MNNHFFNFFLEASKDLVPKHSVINLRGHNTDVDTSTVPETVTGLGSIYEFIIDGKRLYRVYSKFITIKYEYQGNEEEYNPSWA